ncbi:hypothetical protein FRC19_008279 [Serendipita sp. 401]|nr:hypothetical protein FRC19_008279 [Serendipita sp. 401]
MSDSGRRVGSPTPSGINQNGTGSASGPVLSGRNRAASTSKSVFSVKSNKTTASYQLTGSKKINTAPQSFVGCYLMPQAFGTMTSKISWRGPWPRSIFFNPLRIFMAKVLIKTPYSMGSA